MTMLFGGLVGTAIGGAIWAAAEAVEGWRARRSFTARIKQPYLSIEQESAMLREHEQLSRWESGEWLVVAVWLAAIVAVVGGLLR